MDERRAVKKVCSEITSLEERLDSHIAIYSDHINVYRENGVESKRVGDLIAQMVVDSKSRDERVDAMWKDHMDSKAVTDKIELWMARITKFFAFVVAIIGLIAALKWILAQ